MEAQESNRLEEYGTRNRKDARRHATIQWFAIDEYKHGSFATYTSKEVYDDFKAELDSYREKVSSSLDLEKTFDTVEPINVDVS